VKDKYNKLKDTPYNPDSTRKTSVLSKYSQDSYPIRLNSSNPSDKSDDERNFEYETPEEVEQLYQDLLKNMKEGKPIPDLSSFSQKSKPIALDSKRDMFKDWAETPLYEEYQSRGKRVYPSINENKYYTAEETTRVYHFIKNRYSSRENEKPVTTFYKKAMATLFLLTDDQMNFDTYLKIKTMYSKVDVTNTLKLLIRCTLMYGARRKIVEIFENIRMFKVLSSKAKNLISLHLDFQGEAKQSTDRMVRNCGEIEKWEKQLLENIVSFLQENKLFGTRWFIFEKVEWLSFSIKEYQRIQENAAKVGVVMKDINSLECLET